MVPRVIGIALCPPIRPVRPYFLDLDLFGDELQLHGLLGVVQHLADTEEPHGDHEKITPPRSPVRPKVRRGRPEKASIPGVEISSPRKVPTRAFSTDPPVRPAMVQSPMSIRAKYSGGPKESANFTSGIDEQHQKDDAGGPGDEGADGRDPEGLPGPALQGHLVAVQAGHDGRRFPRDVDQTEVMVPPYIAPQ